MDNKDMVLKLKAFFETRPDVELAFLFGSAARGRSIEESDVGIAIWLKKPNHARFKSVWSKLEEITGRGQRLAVKDKALFLNLVLERSREAEDFSEWLLDLWRLRRQIKKAG